ncbi:hypothetical protein RM555_25340 [Micromonospora sp. DSM 115977]|uniref:Phospholipase D-like domain-containing protein n=1 Tax=Micromonospora reichwaldensis TaxID=3075516 RepID=A0ABU2X2C1_9ACTN|nr:hypothetical protein [Micromonospora sp. DSM 115977]MDT0532330.1 hypothetical protein [Micromonospora sp. DSM 115977]
MTDWDDLLGAAPPAVLHARLIPDAEEVLVLTYTCDLSFFEDVCLRDAQAVRARTTVLFDAHHLTEGPRRPGPADYLALPVVCKGGGAFHPKLVVVASETDAVVAVGSGNATASGWHHNAEVWTLVRGEGPTVPALLHQLADWLRRLPDDVWMEDLGRDRLNRVAELLTTRPPDQSAGQPVLVTTALRPIIEQLPRPVGPATQLAVAAPFFDPEAGALRRLVDRFRPQQARLLLTRDVQCDPDSLARVVKRVPDAAVSTPASFRYHHGKVVEWWSSDLGWALTGSANCSHAALTKTMSAGGNCELGVVSPLTAPLVTAVAAEAVSVSDLARLHVRDPSPSAPTATESLRVLGVRIGADRVEATVLVGSAGTPPRWLAVNGLRLDHDRETGKLHVYAGVPDSGWTATAGGRAVSHVVTDDGTEDRDVLVTDVAAALARVERPSPLDDRSLPQVLADSAHTAALFEALRHLASVRPDRISQTSAGGRRRQVENRVKSAVGPALLRFALGLNDARTATSADDEDIFEGADPESPSSPSRRSRPASAISAVPGTLASVLDTLAPGQRTRLRNDVTALVDASQAWPLPAQLAVSRLMLLLVAGGLWSEAADWADLLYWVLVQLWDTEQEESLDGEHAALATVGLVALRRGIDLHDEPDGQQAGQFEELRIAYREWTGWLATAPPETIQRYCSGLGGHTLGLLFEQTDFTAELRWLLGRTALHDAVERLDGAHVDAKGVVHVEARRSARHSLIAALDALRDFPDVHVVAEGGPETHGWWNGRRLLVVTRSGPAWRAELWKGLLTGIAVFARGTPLRPADQKWTAATPEEAFTQATAGSQGALLR